jgi:hypothetical protein
MANIVTTKLLIKSDNQKLKEKITRQFDLFEWKTSDGNSFYEAVFESDKMTNGELIAEGSEQYQEDMGAEYCSLNEADFYSGVTQLLITSDWSYPEGAFKQIYKMAAAIDKDVLVSCAYKDENYDFIGAATYVEGNYNRIELENGKFPDSPNSEFATDTEFDAAYAAWENQIEEILVELNKECENKSRLR